MALENEQPPRVVRRCAACGKATLVHGMPDRPILFVCTNCGAKVEIDNLSGMLASLFAGALFLAALLLDGHPFWMLLHLLQNPTEILEAFSKYGAIEAVTVLLFLVITAILLVGLPLATLGWVVKSACNSFRNPIVADVIVTEGNATQVPHKPMRWLSGITVGSIARALFLALSIHAVFIAIATLSVLYFDRETLEAILEDMLPGLLLSGGILFGTRRWMVAIIFALLLPVSGFAIAVLSGQVSL